MSASVEPTPATPQTQEHHSPVRTALTSFYNTNALSLNYTMADIRRRPRNFCIGIASIIIVVFFVGLILDATSKTPLILVRFAELNIGEMDAIVLAEGSVPFVNYTEMGPMIAKSKDISGTSPRWLLRGEVQSLDTYNNFLREQATFNAGANASTFNTSAPTEEDIPTLTTNVVIIDSEKEKEVGIGRAWPYREIGYSEAQIYHSALHFVGVRPNVGRRARMFLDIEEILNQQNVAVTLPSVVPTAETFLPPGGETTIGNFTIQNDALLDFVIGNGTNATIQELFNNATQAPLDVTSLLRPEIRMTVADSVRDIEGKYPAALGNMVVLDYRQLVEMFADQQCVSPNTGTAVLGPLGASPVQGLLGPIIEGIRMEEYALLVVAMFTNRFDIYYTTGLTFKREMIRVTNDLVISLGIDFGGSLQYPLAVALEGFYFLQLFLDSIFFSVVAVVIVLGALLVYTLLLTNSEERSFEVAMIRAQGMAKTQLLHLMLTQALAFIVPGCLIAISLLYGINAIVEVVLAEFTKAPAQTARLPGHAIGVSVGMGFVVPLIANWGPIKSAMSQSLRDALDVYRQTSNEVKVTMLKLAELGLEPWQTLLGWFLTISGFLIYYMIPFAFTFNQLWLFFLILNLILLTMLFGLCMMAYALQEPLEKAALWLILWGPDRKLKTLVSKNLHSHRERNSKSFMMFTCSIACIIFGGVLFTLLANSLSDQIKIFNGSDVSLTSLNDDFPLNRSLIENFLDNSDLVAAYTFLTFPLGDYSQFTGNTVISNVLGFPRRSIRVVGTDANYLDTVFPQFVQVAEYDNSYDYPTSKTGIKDFIRSMYDEPPLDSLEKVGKVYTGFPPNVTEPNVDAKYNVIIPCAMPSQFIEIMGASAKGYATLRLKYSTGSDFTAKERTSIFLMRPRAMMNRISGWPGVSSLRFAGGGAIFLPIHDFKTLMSPSNIDFAGDSSAEYRMSPDTVFEPSYQKLFIRLKPGITASQRTDFVNFLQSRVNPYYHQPLDTAEVLDAVKLMSDLIIYFFFFVSAVVIVLDTFMLWLSFVSNVKLNSWSFGVLRALGFTLNQLIRGYIYEALSIVLSSFLVGTIIGTLVAVTLILQMNLFLQLPFSFAFPWQLFLFVFGMSLLSAIAGSIIPSHEIGKRSIAGVLKGM